MEKNTIKELAYILDGLIEDAESLENVLRRTPYMVSHVKTTLRMQKELGEALVLLLPSLAGRL